MQVDLDEDTSALHTAIFSFFLFQQQLHELLTTPNVTGVIDRGVSVSESDSVQKCIAVNWKTSSTQTDCRLLSVSSGQVTGFRFHLSYQTHIVKSASGKHSFIHRKQAKIRNDPLLLLSVREDHVLPLSDSLSRFQSCIETGR